MRLPECIQERGGAWHVADGPADEAATFRYILCGRETGEGLMLPGNGVERQPTCVECYQLWRLHESDGSTVTARGGVEDGLGGTRTATSGQAGSTTPLATWLDWADRRAPLIALATVTWGLLLKEWGVL